jgi:hypothetical protein
VRLSNTGDFDAGVFGRCWWDDILEGSSTLSSRSWYGLSIVDGCTSGDNCVSRSSSRAAARVILKSEGERGDGGGQSGGEARVLRGKMVTELGAWEFGGEKERRATNEGERGSPT